MTHSAQLDLTGLADHDWPSLAEAVSDGSAEVEILKDTPRRLLVRTAVGPVESVVVKLWRNGGVRYRIRRGAAMDDAAREWRTMRRLTSVGVRVPRPIAFCRLNSGGLAHSDAICMEDVGRCMTALQHMKTLIAGGRAEDFATYETALIEATARIVAGGMLDTDCSMTNFVVTSQGELVRLDLEMTRYVATPTLFPRRYGEMIGRLVASFTFAIQPRMDLAREFAHRLAERLRPPRRALMYARRTVESMLARQYEQKGIESRLELDW